MVYDIVIVGSGVSACFLALSLLEDNKNNNILMLDKGQELDFRQCPLEKNKSSVCLNCSICNKLSGFGGLGKSEGKYNFSAEFGGNLVKKIGLKNTYNYFKKVDEYLIKFGAEQTPHYITKNLFPHTAKNVKIIIHEIRHLGSNVSIEFLKNIFAHLLNKIDFKFKQEILNVNYKNEIFKIQSNNNVFFAKKLVICTGNSGASLVEKICENFNIIFKNRRLDLGLRLELANEQLNKIVKNSFEFKILYKDKNIEFMTYCMNPNGYVVARHQEGFTFTDGQNFREREMANQNSNFAILVPQYFPIKKADEYLKMVMEKLNKGQNRLIVQRLEDLYLKQATANSKMLKNKIIPSLKCSYENLYAEVPKIYIAAALKLISLIEEMVNVKISNDALLYGLDGKLYQAEVPTNHYFETKQKSLYFIGDCTGETSSLSHAAASGLFLANRLKEQN